PPRRELENDTASREDDREPRRHQHAQSLDPHPPPHVRGHGRAEGHQLACAPTPPRPRPPHDDEHLLEPLARARPRRVQGQVVSPPATPIAVHPRLLGIRNTRTIKTPPERAVAPYVPTLNPL